VTMRCVGSGACLVLVAGLGWGQAAGPLVLEDFTKALGERWKGGIELAKAEDGKPVGRWYGAREGDQLSLMTVPKDWTPYKAVDLWVWSATANKQEFMLIVDSGNPDTGGADSFYRKVVVDWEGWRQLAFRLSGLTAYRTPKWDQVASLTLATAGWGVQARPDTDLCLGEVRLLTEAPEGAIPRADVVSAFEIGDIGAWRSLVPDTEHVKEGECAGRWEGFGDLEYVRAELEMDWTAYQFLEFDCYSAAPTGDRFIFCIVSMDQPRPRNDYWAYILKVDWEDWKHFRIPFRRLHHIRNPLGWQKITGIEMYPNGWGMRPSASPDTVLVFDDMHLTKGEARTAPPGMVEDFEDGPWGWWWMDEGSVPARVGEHCGELPLHEGWRELEGDSFATTDWTPYKTLKLWVYAKQLPGEVLEIRAYGEGGMWTGDVPLDGEGWREAALQLTPNPGKVSAITLQLRNLEGDDNGKANRDLDPAAVLCLDDIRLE